MAFPATLAIDLHAAPLAFSLPALTAARKGQTCEMEAYAWVCAMCLQRMQLRFRQTRGRTPRIRTKTATVANMPAVALKG